MADKSGMRQPPLYKALTLNLRIAVLAKRFYFAKTAIDFCAKLVYNTITVLAIRIKNADIAMKEGAGNEAGKDNRTIKTKHYHK